MSKQLPRARPRSIWHCTRFPCRQARSATNKLLEQFKPIKGNSSSRFIYSWVTFAYRGVSPTTRTPVRLNSSEIHDTERAHHEAEPKLLKISHRQLHAMYVFEKSKGAMDGLGASAPDAYPEIFTTAGSSPWLHARSTPAIRHIKVSFTRPFPFCLHPK